MIFILDNNYIVQGIMNVDSPDGVPFFNDQLTVKNDGTTELVFDVPFNSPFYDYFNGEGHILYKTQEGKIYLLRVTNVWESDNPDDDIVREVTCENMAIGDLNRHLVRPINYPAYTGANNADFTLASYVNYCLAGTDWVLGSIDNVDGATTSHNFTLDSYSNTLQLLQDGFDTWGCSPEYVVQMDGLKIVGKKVNLYTTQQTIVDKVFTFGVDVKGIKRTVVSDEVINALCPLGKAQDTTAQNRIDLTMATVAPTINSKYAGDIIRLAAPNADLIASKSAMQRYGNGKLLVGMLETEDTDFQQLLDDGCKELSKKCKPQMQYEISIQTLKELSMIVDEKEVDLGWTVIVIDESFNPPIRVEATCVEKHTSWTVPENNEVVLGEFLEILYNSYVELQPIASTVNKSAPSWDTTTTKVNSGVADTTNSDGIQLHTLNISSADGESKIVYISNQDTDPTVNMVKMSSNTIIAQGANGAVLATPIEEMDGFDPTTGAILITSSAQMQQVLSALPNYIYRRVELRLQANVTGNFIIEGLYGGGELIIVQGNYNITGSMIFLRCSCRVGVSSTGGKINGLPAGVSIGSIVIDAFVVVAGCPEVELFGLQIYSGGSGSSQASYGIHCSQSNVIMTSSNIFNCQNCIFLKSTLFNSVGNAGKATNGYGVYATQGSIVTGDSIPQGSGGTGVAAAILLASGAQNLLTSPSYNSGTNDGTTAPTTTTARFSNSSAFSWNTLYNWRTASPEVVQGEWESYGHNRGCWFFGTNLSTALAGKTISSMKIYVTRKSNAGYSTAPVKIHTHDMAAYTDSAGDPLTSHIYTGAEVDVSQVWGTSQWIDVTPLASRFSAGTAKGFCVYTPSTSDTEYGKFNTDITVEVTYS